MREPPPAKSEWLPLLVRLDDEQRGDGEKACAQSVGKFDADARRRLRVELDAVGREDGDNRTGRACWLIFIDYGRSVDDGWQYLVEWNARRHEPHDERELRRRMRRALDYKADARRGDKVWTVAVREKKRGPDTLDLVFMDTVQRREVKWLWHGRIPFGAVTIFDGDPGLGKSTVLLDLAARVSTGRPMPGEMVGREAACAIVLTAEDALDFVVGPRLDAAKADSSRVAVLRAVVDESGDKMLPCLPAHFEQLRHAIERTGAIFVAIDPLMAYLGDGVDSAVDAKIRHAIMAPLAALAEESGAAIVALRHLRKQAGSALARGGGSIGFTAAARSALFFGRDPDDESACVIASTKSNLGRMPPAMRYAIAGPDDGVGHVEWLGESEVTADELATGAQRGETKTDACEQWLSTMLADGRREYAEIRAAAEARGFDIKSKPMIAARKRLESRSTKPGGGIDLRNQ